jgi:parallel beta-helix repeat protein
MRGATLRAIAMLIALAGFLVLGGSTAVGYNENGATTLVVDDNMACPSADYPSIQAAVTAAGPGWTILVCPGVYNEQVRIPKPLRILGQDFANQDAPIVKPVGGVPNSTSLASGNPITAIIVADHAEKVEIEGLTVDGGNIVADGCATQLVGIFYRNTSGLIDHNAVRNINLGAGLEGCQSGQGIFVQSGNGGSSVVDIEHNTLHEYQKTGILVNEVGSQADILGNTVNGVGSSPIIAQNGIQIGWGATGTVVDNAVMNHVYAPCISVNQCPFSASNVLVFGLDGPARDVVVFDNVLGNSQVNVWFENNGGKVEKNLIFDSQVFDGIFVFGNQNRIIGNRVNNSDEAAIWVEGTKNTVSMNTINEATEGIHDSTGGNSYGFNAFYNVVNKRTPAPTSLNTMTLAVPTAEVEETTLVGLPSLNVPTAAKLRP